MSIRSELTPQMLGYEQKFTDNGEMRWLPYLMYFHPENHASSVVNTDSVGFRYSEYASKRYAVADNDSTDSVRLLAGSSTVFGIGASADRHTLSSRLSENDPRPQRWLNFGGRSFNSTQELMLMVLYQHLLPKVDEIVLFSGFNNLGLARLPDDRRLDHGAFFNCNQFFDAFSSDAKGESTSLIKRILGSNDSSKAEQKIPSMEQQIRYASDLTLRHLKVWQSIAKSFDAKLTYILQPLAGWVRTVGCKEEEALFEELDRLGRFKDVYGDILQLDVCHEYASQLAQGAEKLDVNFINISPILSESTTPDQWLFVDRIHFTDDGHDFVAKKILELI